MNHLKQNNLKWISRIVSIYIVVFLFTGLALEGASVFSYAETEGKGLPEEKVVRVGYYTMAGFQEKLDKNQYSGYSYEFFREIGQLAGWDYEFVDGTYGQCLNRLKNGEVDIVAGVDKTQKSSEKLIFSTYSNYIASLKIFCLNSNDEFTYGALDKLDGVTIGVTAGKEGNSQLAEYFEQRGISYIEKIYATPEDLARAVEKKGVDVALDYQPPGEKVQKVLFEFDEVPLYYAAMPENEELLREVDVMMHNIKTSNSIYQMQLEEKYRNAGINSTPSFTEEEEKYIRERGTIRVSYDMAWYPFEYVDEETGEMKGITKDLYEKVSEYTGLKFEFVRGETLAEALDMVKTGEADMISLVSHDYDISDERGIYTTRTCLKATLTGVVSKEKKIDSITTIAMQEDYFLDILKNYAVKYYETTDECFEAVNSGKADATIANVYSANYYLANPKFGNLIRQDLVGYSEDLALGVSKREDVMLINILNKGIQCISDDDISEIVFNNYVVYDQPKIKKLYYSSPEFFVGFIALAVTIVIGIFLYIISLQRKAETANKHLIELLNNEKIRVEQSLRKEADQDSLTGLYNRRKLEEETRDFLMSRYPSKKEDKKKGKKKKKTVPSNNNLRYGAMYLLDMDNFKLVNDKYGHPEGDRLLKEISHELKLFAGETDIAARLGGDEFMVVMKNVSGPKEVVEKGEKLCQIARDVAEKDCKWSEVSASVGGIMLEEGQFSYNQMYEKVDRALYQAKMKGRNQFVFHP